MKIQKEHKPTQVLLGNGMILNLELLPVAKLLDGLGQKLLIHIVIQIVYRHLHLRRLAHIIRIDKETRHRKFHRVLLLLVPVDVFPLPRVGRRRHNVMQVAGNRDAVVADHLFANVLVQHRVQDHLQEFAEIRI